MIDKMSICIYNIVIACLIQKSTVNEILMKNSAVFKCQLCILTLAFSCQMTNPAIQNDFSYYRRTLSRMRINNQAVSVSGSRSPCKSVSLSQGLCFGNAPFPRVTRVNECTSVL